MKTKPALKITYDAFPCNNEIEDFDKIEEFREEIDQNYASIVKATPVGRGGGAYEFLVELFANLSAKDYLLAVGAYLGNKILDKTFDPILESYIFTPFKEAYTKLKEENPRLDCHTITIELTDTKIYLYSISEDSLIENKDQILLTLDENFHSLVREDEFPREIHIPIYYEEIGGKHIYRPPLSVDETIDIGNTNNFLKLWGLKYEFHYASLAYDVVNKQVLVDTEFMTEEELDYYRRDF